MFQKGVSICLCCFLRRLHSDKVNKMKHNFICEQVNMSYDFNGNSFALNTVITNIIQKNVIINFAKNVLSDICKSTLS